MFKQLLAFSLAAAALAFAAGCKSLPLDGTNTNIGVYNYGEFQGLHNVNSSAAVTKAVLGAMKQFGLIEVAINEKQFSTDIVARDEKDLKIQIWVQEYNSLQTLLRIRWGSGGDLEKSRAFYTAVEAGLTGAPAAIAEQPAPPPPNQYPSKPGYQKR